MRAAWRLAISSVSARPSRAALLVAAVALSAALISAVACGFASANRAIESQLEQQLGSAEVRLTGRGGGSTFDAKWLEAVRSWPGVERAVPRKRSPLSMRTTHEVLQPAEGDAFVRTERDYTATGYGNGVDFSVEFAVRPPVLLAGRLPEAEAVNAKLEDTFRPTVQPRACRFTCPGPPSCFLCRWSKPTAAAGVSR